MPNSLWKSKRKHQSLNNQTPEELLKKQYKTIESIKKTYTFAIMSLTKKHTEYINWVNELKTLIQRTQIKASISVNRELMGLY